MIAHSYGSYVALKLAEKLEAEGKYGVITFLDGAPTLIRALASDHYKNSNDEASIQNSVIIYIFSNVFGTVDDNFVNKVSSLGTWNEKVDLILEFTNMQKQYGKEYLRSILNALVNRVKIIMTTDVKISSLKSTLATLVRPTIASVKNISENYDLDVNFKEKVDVMYLEGNHFSLLENPLLLETLNNVHSTLEIQR